MVDGKKALTLSIVIPAYNEERHLGECLDSLAAQTIPFYEVILVNNNSTDKTAQIAKSHSFVTYLEEHKQGYIPARDRGFKEAKGDILVRINADVVLKNTWVEEAINAFSDPSIAAISGPGYTRLFPGFSRHGTFWSDIYFYTSTSLLKTRQLWGANMALRRSAWIEIKSEVCDDQREVHEDQDISMLLAGKGLKIKYLPDLNIYTEGLEYFYWPKFKEYVIRLFKTKIYHNKRGTLKNKRALVLPRALTTWMSVVAFLPSVFFGLMSFLFYYVGKLFNHNFSNQ